MINISTSLVFASGVSVPLTGASFAGSPDTAIAYIDELLDGATALDMDRLPTIHDEIGREIDQLRIAAALSPVRTAELAQDCRGLDHSTGQGVTLTGSTAKLHTTITTTDTGLIDAIVDTYGPFTAAAISDRAENAPSTYALCARLESFDGCEVHYERIGLGNITASARGAIAHIQSTVDIGASFALHRARCDSDDNGQPIYQLEIHVPIDVPRQCGQDGRVLPLDDSFSAAPSARVVVFVSSLSGDGLQRLYHELNCLSVANTNTNVNSSTETGEKVAA